MKGPAVSDAFVTVTGVRRASLPVIPRVDDVSRETNLEAVVDREIEAAPLLAVIRTQMTRPNFGPVSSTADDGEMLRGSASSRVSTNSWTPAYCE
jgi:hypothetical protein